MKTPSYTAAPVSTLFVGSAIDDAELNVYQFRILGHLHRRAGADGLAWPSIRTIAEVCKIGERVVRRSLRELVNLGHVEAEERPGQTTLYRPAACKPTSAPTSAPASAPTSAPLSDQPDLPLADRTPEGIPRKVFPTPTRQPAASDTRTAPERSEQVVVGASDRLKPVQKPKLEHLDDDQKDAAGALVEFGIVGAKLQALSRSGLTAKEIRRTCRKVAESGGRAGAMVLHLEAAAGRKAEGHKIEVGFTFTPAKPPPTWQDDMTEAERAEVVEACRKFRQAG